MIYKRKNKKKEKRKKIKKNGFQGHSSWLWSLPLWMGFGYCPVMFPWLAELVPVFWLMELDLVSERQCRVQ